jgi:putative nucleotidyltransferase with HDIG domain
MKGAKIMVTVNITENHDEFIRLLRESNRSGINNLINYLEKNTDFFTAPCSLKHHLACEGGLVQHSINVAKLAKTKWALYLKDSDVTEDSAVFAALTHDIGKINTYQKNVEEQCSDKQLSYLKDLMEETTEANLKQLIEEGLTPKYVGELLQNKELKKKSLLIEKNYIGSLIDWLLKSPKNSCPIRNREATYSIKPDAFPMAHEEKSILILGKFVPLKECEMLAIRYHMALFNPTFTLDFISRKNYEAAVKSTPLIELIQICDYEASSLLER